MSNPIQFAPDSFAGLSPADRDGILAFLRQATAEIVAAQERIPRTLASVVAKIFLAAANDALLNLYQAVRTAGGRVESSVPGRGHRSGAYRAMATPAASLRSSS